jgi:formylglycine-generating enzyme required for sulfatase activity
MDEVPEDLRERLLAECVAALERGDRAWIDRACGEHPLLAEEIRATARALEALSDDAGHAAPSRPRRIGRFQLLRELGRGGGGVVHLARDTRLGRLVALKVLPSAYASSPAALERFRRETQALAKASHPHIAAIHEVGEDEGGAPYFAMEYVEGESLESILRRNASLDLASLRGADLLPGEGRPAGDGPSPPTPYVVALVRLVAKVASALERAHEVGVIHRDLKPGNVLVDRGGEPHLVDFGLARGTDAVTVTRPEAAPGTPLYMAPEQVSAARGSIGPWTDVYGLGATLYHALALRPPFSGETTEQVFDQIRTRVPESPRRLNPQVPRDLETVLFKAIEKDPRRRYPTAAAFREDLEALLTLRPIGARPPGPALRAWRWVRARPGRSAAVGLSTAAAIATIAAIAISWSGEWEGRRALAAFRKSDELAAKAMEELYEIDRRTAAFRRPEESGRMWHFEEVHREHRSGADGALERAEGAFRSALFGKRFLRGIRPGSASSLAVVLRERGRRLRGTGEEAAGKRLEDDADEWDPAGRGLARISIRTDLEANLHLFRYEPIRASPPRPYPVPRLVPVPVEVCDDRARAGLAIEVEGFDPGEFHWVVTGVEEGSPAAAAGIAEGDLIRSIGKASAEEGLFVAEVDPDGPAARAGVQPYDRIVEVGGKPIRDFYDWETVPTTKGPPEDSYLAVFDGPTEAGKQVSATLAPGELQIPSMGKVAPVDIRVRGRWFPRQGARVEGTTRLPADEAAKPTTLEEAFGLRTTDLTGPLPPVGTSPLTLSRMREGKWTLDRLGPGRSPRITLERTANPLAFLAGNRLPLTPPGLVRLPRGSYLAVVRDGPWRGTRFPFLVEDLRDLEVDCRLAHVPVPPPGFVYVPGGPFIYQGDRQVAFAEPEDRGYEDGFCIARFEVTMEKVLEFLNEAQAWPEERWQQILGDLAEIPLREDWRFERVDTRLQVPRKATARSAAVPLPDTAVTGYIEWLNRRATERGSPWRFHLPTNRQWEKAARGVDGRLFPWGFRFDPALTYSYQARWHGDGDQAGSILFLEPVGRFPTDESPYGVRDLAGGASEVNRDRVTPSIPGWTAVRGGAWVFTTPLSFRSTNMSPGSASVPMLGLRLVAVLREERK